jgi:hypothetical protein
MNSVNIAKMEAVGKSRDFLLNEVEAWQRAGIVRLVIEAPSSCQEEQAVFTLKVMEVRRYKIEVGALENAGMVVSVIEAPAVSKGGCTAVMTLRDTYGMVVRVIYPTE